MVRNSLLGLGLLSLAGCDAGKDGALVQHEVGRFHQAYDGDRIEQIYNEATADLQKTRSKEDTIHFLEVLRQKLGKSKSSNQTGWRDNVNTTGHTYVVVYKTEFENGEGIETFNYLLADGSRPKLLSYNVNSDALVLK